MRLLCYAIFVVLIIEIMPIMGKKIAPAARKTALTLNKYLIWCYQRLSDHPVNKKRALDNLPSVNCLVTQRPGKQRPLMPFSEKWGLRGLSISSGAIYWGLCSELGMDVAKVKDTGK